MVGLEGEGRGRAEIRGLGAELLVDESDDDQVFGGDACF